MPELVVRPQKIKVFGRPEGGYFTGSKFSMGENSYVNRRCLVDCAHEAVEIGNNVGIAYNVSIYTTNHNMQNPNKRTGDVIGQPVKINDGAWIGANAVICPGVTIGKGCVIAAGSVVTHSCEDNSIYGGNPARKIRNLN